jgi:hypothetical protein
MSITTKKLSKTKKQGFILIEERSPAITVGAMKKSAATNIPWEEQLSELVENGILSDKNKCVDVVINMHHDDDDEKSFIEVSDNSIGIPADKILDVFNLGSRVNTEYFLLGKMGMGMKGAIWGIGEMDYVVSKTERSEKCEVRPTPYSNLNDVLVYRKIQCDSKLLDAQKSGTIVRIKRVTEFLPKWTSRSHFDKFIDKYNSMYAKLISDKRVNISVCYSSNKSRFQGTCIGSFPLMSNPRHILDDDPEIVIGHNEPSYKKSTKQKIENVEIKTPNTSVRLSAWHKPTPQQVERYFEKTKNPIYEPDGYKRSVFGYGHDKSGITVMYKGKLIQFGLEKETSRETDKGILIEITDDSGLKFTQYKNTLVMNNNYRECLEAVREYLWDAGFLIRSLTGTQQVDEKEIVENFIEFAKNDTLYQKSLGIVDFKKQVKLWVDHECGQTDILIVDAKDPKKALYVIEAKKDRCGGAEASQLFRYMAYHQCTNGILLTGAKEIASFSATIDVLKKFMNRPEIEVERIDVTSLHSAKFFKY